MLGLYHLMTYIVFKSLLFLFADVIIHLTKNKKNPIHKSQLSINK